MSRIEPGGRWSRIHRAFVRPFVSLALVVTATLLLAPALLVNWTRSQIYDRDSFADSAVVALKNDAVHDALVQEIVDEIVVVGSPDAGAIRPLIEFVTATVVDSVAFQEIFRDSVKQLHRETLEQTQSDAEPVALTLVDALIVITAYIQQAYPEVASQLPANLGDAFINIRTRDWAVETVAYGQDVTELAIVLPAILFFLYAAALLFSNNPRQTLVLAGVGCVIVAILLIVGRDLARELVFGSGFGDKAVSEAIWNVYTRSLVGWAALTGGFGLVLVVAATAVHRANPGRQLELALRAVSYSPEAAWSRIVRAAGFILIGLLVLVQRDEFLELIVLLVAAYLVYYGLSELIWLATGGTPAFVARPGLPRRPVLITTGRLAMRAGAVAMLAAASAGGIFYAYTALQTAAGEEVAPPRVNGCNGHPQLCDRRLNELVFLGTHNSMAAASEPGWYFSSQLQGIRSQLDAGVRVLLLDTYYGYDTGHGVRTADRDFVAEALPPDDFSEQVIEAARRLAGVIGGVEPVDPKGTYLCHAFCELGATPLTPALAGVNDFLEANPGEVVILLIQDAITPADTAKAFIASGLVNHVHTLTPGEPLPTLRELIESDERVLVFSDSGAPGVDWYMPAHEFIQDTPFRVDTPEQFSCDFGRGKPDNTLFALDHWLSQSFPSTASARQINDFEFLYRRVSQCHRERERKVNFVIVNFVQLGEAGTVVDYLNGVGPWPHPGE
jgi:hypothetical protein